MVCKAEQLVGSRQQIHEMLGIPVIFSRWFFHTPHRTEEENNYLLSDTAIEYILKSSRGGVHSRS